MRAEEVYNIAIHLPEREMERLYALLEKRICKKDERIRKPSKKKLITEDEARKYLLKTIFRIDKF